jgi:23S rRNA (cytidine1920-2'-O)/16S rRNA (cytidine1409-2'-O)-methyltransferase
VSPSPPRRFVSRGGEKLDGALDTFGVDVSGLRALDAGASTGGFTDCLLKRGAREVVAADVAYGQLAWELRNDPRVRVMERTNVRALNAEAIGGPADLVVADLAFISLVTVAGALVACTAPHGALVLMVKPQFELPRAMVPRGGVVTDDDARLDACARVASAYRALGCALAGATPSSLKGPKGNREFFLLFARAASGDGGGAEAATDVGDAALHAAVRSAP